MPESGVSEGALSKMTCPFIEGIKKRANAIKIIVVISIFFFIFSYFAFVLLKQDINF